MNQVGFRAIKSPLYSHGRASRTPSKIKIKNVIDVCLNSPVRIHAWHLKVSFPTLDQSFITVRGKRYRAAVLKSDAAYFSVAPTYRREVSGIRLGEV